MFDLGDMFIFLLFVGFVMLWWNAQGVKHQALKSTKDYCEKMGVQLLDEGLVLKGFWLKRNSSGSLCWWRSYNFEFTTTGEQRYGGQTIMLSRWVEEIRLDPHRLN